MLLSDLSSDLLKGKVDKVLAADAADALEVTWLDRSVAVTHVTLRQHILAAHGYAVSTPAPAPPRAALARCGACAAESGLGGERRTGAAAHETRSAPQALRGAGAARRGMRETRGWWGQGTQRRSDAHAMTHTRAG